MAGISIVDDGTGYIDRDPEKTIIHGIAIEAHQKPNAITIIQDGVAEILAKKLPKVISPEVLSEQKLALEVMVLLSIITDAITDRLIANKEMYSPYGLGSRKDLSEKYDLSDLVPLRKITPDMANPFPQIRANPFEIIELSMATTLYAYVEDVLNNPGDLENVVRRFKEIYASTPANVRQLKMIGRASPPDVLIKKGCGTAATFFANTFEVIYDLYMENPDFLDKSNISELIEIAKNSLPLVMKIASLRIDQFAIWRQRVTTRRGFGSKFNPSFFELIKNDKGKCKLSLKDDTFLSSEEEFLHTGCPALVKFFDGGSGINQLWKIALGVLPDLYGAQIDIAKSKIA